MAKETISTRQPRVPRQPKNDNLGSFVDAVTPTPKQDSFLGKLYALIDFAAINIGKAKDEGKK